MKAVDLAKLYVGYKEKPGNSGFLNHEFEVDMINEGWKKGDSWCATFTKLIFTKANPDKLALKHLFSPGAVQTFNNFKAAHYPILQKPVIGSLVIWQHFSNGVADWRGHAGIVTEVVSDKFFKTVEGNTNNDGSSNGDGVYERVRSTEVKKNGLNVLGFVVI